MVRPKKMRLVESKPEAEYFKPRGIPLSELEEVHLSIEEIEAMRLRFTSCMEQAKAAKKMGVSRTTFWRILCSAGKKVSEALACGKAIRIEGGTFKVKE